MFGYHYTSLKIWEELNKKPLEERFLKPTCPLISCDGFYNLDVPKDLPQESYDKYLFAFLNEKGKSSWRNYIHAEKQWNNLTNDVVRPEQRLVIGHLKVDKKYASIVYDRIINEATSENNVATNETTTTETTEETPTKKPQEEPTPTPVTMGSDDEGLFVSSYAVNTKNMQIKTGSAATFKSTSGWVDRKYYVLINDIPAGTIVRITANNNRSICAKVLGELPEMKENKNLVLRISNAGAAVLGISDARFDVKITYPK